MQIITSIEQWKAVKQLFKGKKIGLVPTMGYLHIGHVSLLQLAKRENDIAVMSVFVNPLQFGPTEDFDKYPRDLERDIEMATEGGIDIVFAPSVMEMYPNPLFTKVIISGLTDRLCGSSRPGHFDGVATVVSKLFHIIEPDSAYFGQKDAQQLAVIEQLVRDLNFNVSIVPCPTIREADGLAMSSRNVYLTSEERNQAVVLSQALKKIEKAWLLGERDLTLLQSEAREIISQAPLAKIDYVEILSYPDLMPIDYEQNIKYVVALAVFFGKTRLIDNVILE